MYTMAQSNNHFNFGDRLIVELNTREIFEGDFVEGSKNRIDIMNVRQNHNTIKLGGVYSFYRTEIHSVYICKKKEHKPEEKEPEHKSCECPAKVSKQITIEAEEYQRLRDMTENYIYMDNLDSRYFTMAEKLMETETVGVVALGMEQDRQTAIKLLVLSTWKQVYILDLTNVRSKKFPPELKEVFESSYITKVAHSAAQLVDCLYNVYDVYLENVFDTQVVDLIIAKKETGNCSRHLKLLSECVTECFNFPPSLLKKALRISAKDWSDRPLDPEKLICASQLATYLIILKDCMQKKLLREVFDAVDNVHKVYLSHGDYEFKQALHDKKCTKEIDNLIPRLRKHTIGVAKGKPVVLEPSTSSSS